MNRSPLAYICMLALFLHLLVARAFSQSIVYSITKLKESKVADVEAIITSTTTSSTLTGHNVNSHNNLNATTTTTTLIRGQSGLKIYVRSKRFMQKMPRPPKLDHSTYRASDLKDSSKNISLVLAALLDNYDYNQRPAYGGPPAVITTNLEIRSMGPISELDMEYSLDCYFRQKWKDERLRFTGNANFLSLNIKMLDKIWKPDTYFHTGKGSHLHMITTPNKFLRIFKNGLVLYSMRLTIKSLCPMDLHSFPMDKQSCPLILGSYGYPNDQLVYRWDEKPVTFNQKDFTLSQFDIVKTIYRNGTFIFKRGNHSMLQVNFNLRRHVGYFLIQIYVPCSLIVVLSWVSFWINREATAGVTAVLTLSTFGLDSRSDLPRVSYATALDWYTIMCFLFVVFTLLEFAGVHYFTKVGTGEVPIIEIDENWTKSSSEGEEYSEKPDHLSSQARRKRLARRQMHNRKWKKGVRLLGTPRKGPQLPCQYDIQPNQHLFDAQSIAFNQFDSGSSSKYANFEATDDWNSIGKHCERNVYHKPYCPQNPHYPQYLQWENELINRKNRRPKQMEDFRMSYLENYVDKKLKHSSNISLVYPSPNTGVGQSAHELENSPPHLNASWPALAWSNLDDMKGDPKRDYGKYADSQYSHCGLEAGEDGFGNKSNHLASIWTSSIYSLSHCCLQFWYCFTANEQYKQEMKKRRSKSQGIAAVNSVSRIDKVSRISFPFVFIVLNMAYWTFYINERNAEFNQWQ